MLVLELSPAPCTLCCRLAKASYWLFCSPESGQSLVGEYLASIETLREMACNADPPSWKPWQAAAMTTSMVGWKKPKGAQGAEPFHSLLCSRVSVGQL